jgi:hypothetical protein
MFKLEAAGSEHIKRDRRVIIVAETTKSGEEAHQHEEVPVRVEIRCDVVSAVASPADPQSEGEQETTVHHISKHHAKEERERDARKKSGVRLFVVRDAVGVDDVLERL